MNPVLKWALVLVTEVGLAIDAWTHIDLAPTYAHSATAITQAQLFYLEAALVIAAGLALLVRVNLWTAGAAFLIAAGGLALLLLYRYVDVGQIGPIPNMYEPIWYPEKTTSAWGEVLAATGAAALVVLVGVAARQRRRTGALV